MNDVPNQRGRLEPQTGDLGALIRGAIERMAPATKNRRRITPRRLRRQLIAAGLKRKR